MNSFPPQLKAPSHRSHYQGQPSNYWLLTNEVVKIGIALCVVCVRVCVCARRLGSVLLTVHRRVPVGSSVRTDVGNQDGSEDPGWDGASAFLKDVATFLAAKPRKEVRWEVPRQAATVRETAWTQRRGPSGA